jgi:hypothetical protein
MYILGVLLVLGFMFLLKVTEGFKIWNETPLDYPNHDLENRRDTLNGCKKKCIANRSCKGFVTDYMGDGPGNCWLKSELTQGTSVENRWAYLLSRV